jgi:Cellulase (glycosyl hydrolase family 5)
MKSRLALSAVASLLALGCSTSTAPDGSARVDGGSDPATAPDSGTRAVDASTPTVDASVPGSDAGADGIAPQVDGGVVPAGWLYTSGSKIYVSDGTGGGGSPWMGRGVNMDDIFLCGYDNTLWMTSPETTLESMVSGLIGGWKPTFVRISLGMASNPTTVSWLTNPSQYATPMTNVINAIGANPNVYVLVTLRSDASMIEQDTVDGDPEATGLPSDSTTTPNSTQFPTGTDATYVALVDTFARSSFVLFGLTNEPGGNKLTSATIAAAMDHAVGVIRKEEDALGVPHHLVSVQGNGWTSDISFYATTPLPYDNVVYEVHGYPPSTASYTYSNIPVILGEYGSLTDSAAFYADVESKQIPNLAWDFESFSDCSPDLLVVNQSATNLVPTAYGSTVQTYLLAH